LYIDDVYVWSIKLTLIKMTQNYHQRIVKVYKFIKLCRPSVGLTKCPVDKNSCQHFGWQAGVASTKRWSPALYIQRFMHELKLGIQIRHYEIYSFSMRFCNVRADREILLDLNANQFCLFEASHYIEMDIITNKFFSTECQNRTI